MTSMNACSLIIPVYNDADRLKDCLGSLRLLDPGQARAEVIVIDNNSTDHLAQVLAQFPEVLCVREDRPGASAARNRGIAQARGEILVFLDADTTVASGWLRELLRGFDEERVGAVGGAVLPRDPDNLISAYFGIALFLRYPRYGRRRQVKGYPTCNLALRKKLVPEGFDSAVFTTYGEDKDICYRIIRQGYRVLFEPAAVVFHHHPRTFCAFAELCVKSARGRVRFGQKYPWAPDAILFNAHVPALFLCCLGYAFFVRNVFFLGTLLLFPVLYMGVTCSGAYAHTRRAVLSFVIKPFCDTVALYLIYGAYQYWKFKDRTILRSCPTVLA